MTFIVWWAISWFATTKALTLTTASTSLDKSKLSIKVNCLIVVTLNTQFVAITDDFLKIKFIQKTMNVMYVLSTCTTENPVCVCVCGVCGVYLVFYVCIYVCINVCMRAWKG